MMKTNPWLSLDNTVNSRRCNPDHKFDYFWAIGKYNEYLFVIEHKKLEDWSVKNLYLSGIEIEQYQIEQGYRLVLKLNDSSDWDLFLNLCDDLLLATIDSESEAIMLSIVYGRLQRWQKLFRKAGRKLLSSQQQQGLFGELLFLKNKILKKFSEIEAFSFWRGPYGEQQDFGIGTTTVEVKTKRGTSVPYVQISSADQLDCKNENCFLYVITLNVAPQASPEAITLNDIVLDIKKTLESAEALDLFETLLAEAGYIELPEYSDTSYVISRESVYQLNDVFPRLISAMLPVGVHTVEYRVELQTCEPCKVSMENLDDRIING